jgi:Bacterial HORMA domain family 1
MYGTNTTTSTYTVLDIRKTFEGCETDIRTIARRTGKWSMEYVDNIFHDILILAENEYLHSVDIALQENSTDKILKASKFIVNSAGNKNESERAGKNNDWADIPNTHLAVILEYTQKWKNLSPESKTNFRNKFKVSWEASNIDNSFPHLSKIDAQLYASKGYELQKTNFK